MTEISESLWEQAVEAVAENATETSLVKLLSDNGLSSALWKALEGRPLDSGNRHYLRELFEVCGNMEDAVIKKAKSISDAWGDP